MLADYSILLIGAILVNNFVLVQFLGLCPFMGVSNKLETAMGMSMATTFVLTLAAACSHLTFNYLLLEPLGLEYLRTISFILVIAVVVQFTEMVVRKSSPLLHRVLGVYLPLDYHQLRGTRGGAAEHQQAATTSCSPCFTVLVPRWASPWCWCCSLPCANALASRRRTGALSSGAAIGMVTAGLMSLAFMGFAGLV